jgi:hypothetical protein
MNSAKESLSFGALGFSLGKSNQPSQPMLGLAKPTDAWLGLASAAAG